MLDEPITKGFDAHVYHPIQSGRLPVSDQATLDGIGQCTECTCIPLELFDIRVCGLESLGCEFDLFCSLSEPSMWSTMFVPVHARYYPDPVRGTLV